MLIYRVIYDFIDTMRIARRLFKGLPNHKLDTLSSAFNKKYFPSHRAMNDVLATYELLEFFYDYADRKDIDIDAKLILFLDNTVLYDR